MFNIVSSKN